MKKTLIVSAVLIMFGITSGEEVKVFTNNDLETYGQKQSTSQNVGTMNRNYHHESDDARNYNTRRYGNAGASYNRDTSSTNYSKKITEEDIRIIEAEEYRKKLEADQRRKELEFREQIEYARQKEHEEKRRVEKEEERLRRQTELFRLRNGSK